MKLTIFAHNGQITAITFPGEASNYNGAPVMTIEVADGENAAEKLAAHGIRGVGSPFSTVKVVEAPKPAAKKKG